MSQQEMFQGVDLLQKNDQDRELDVLPVAFVSKQPVLII